MGRTLVIALTTLYTLPILPALAGERPARNDVQEFRQKRHEARQDFREERREDARGMWEGTRENRWAWVRAESP